MSAKHVLGIDIGTSGCKTVLCDQSGRIVATGYREYPLHIPRQGWYEQNPADWWQGAQEAVRDMLRQVRGAEVAAIGLSGQMHGLVAIDRNDNVLRPCMIWADARNEEQCGRVHAAAGGIDRLLGYTNNRMLCGYTGGKLLWMQEHEPELFERLDVFLNPKDYIRLMLTGERGTDVSDASGTGLFDVAKRQWSDPLIAKVGLPKRIFPRADESCAVVGKLRLLAAQALGLPPGVPVVAGGGDAVVQSTGTGLLHAGIFGVTIGTGGVVTTSADACSRNVDAKYQVFCHNAPDQWIVMGVSLTAGGALKWLSSLVASAEKEAAATLGTHVYELLDRAAAQVPVGAEGLFFMPHLVGQRCPYPDSASRAAFIGLTLRHTKAHLVRSLLEGVAFSLKEITDNIIVDTGTTCGEVRMTGGGARSALWRQIHADVFGCGVNTMSGATEGAAYGAAMLAGVPAGLWRDLRQAVAVLSVTDRTESNAEAASRYGQPYATYRKLYPALRDLYPQMS